MKGSKVSDNNHRPTTTLVTFDESTQQQQSELTFAERAYRAASMMDLDKFTPAILEPYKDRATNLAIEYLSSYKGNFGFLVSVRESMFRNKTLSLGQVSGVLNCLLAEYKKERKAKEAQVQAQAQAPGTTPSSNWIIPVDHDIPSGRYTCVWEIDGKQDYVTLRISDNEWAAANQTPGTRVVEYLFGPNNDAEYKGFAFLTPMPKPTIRLWKRHVGAERLEIACRILALGDYRLLGKAYAMMSGNCYVCGRTLTTPESIEAGIGPICAERVRGY